MLAGIICPSRIIGICVLDNSGAPCLLLLEGIKILVIHAYLVEKGSRKKVLVHVVSFMYKMKYQVRSCVYVYDRSYDLE